MSIIKDIKNKTKSNKYYDDYIYSILSKKLIYRLFLKYSSSEYNYNNIQIYYLIFNEKCRVVAKFKDYLVLDDNTEFLRNFYKKTILKEKLSKIYNFYAIYSKTFPNYMILPESEYLYKNIRKKQKMIDACNQIKKEEEENRKRLEIGKKGNKKNTEMNNTIFSKNIQDSIQKYQPSSSISIFQNIDKKNFENSMISFSMISVTSKKNNELIETNNQSIDNILNIDNSLSSIALIVNSMKNTITPINNYQIETPKRKVKSYFKNELYQKPFNNAKGIYSKNKNSDKNYGGNKNDTINENKKQISLQISQKGIHQKYNSSFIKNTEIVQNNLQNENHVRNSNSNDINGINIINNFNNIVIQQGSSAIININTNYYNYNSKNSIEQNKFSSSNQHIKSKTDIIKGNTKKKTTKPVSKPSFGFSNKKLILSNKKASDSKSKYNSYKSPEKLVVASLNPIGKNKLDSLKTTDASKNNRFLKFFVDKKILSKPKTSGVPVLVKNKPTQLKSEKLDVMKRKIGIFSQKKDINIKKDICINLNDDKKTFNEYKKSSAKTPLKNNSKSKYNSEAFINNSKLKQKNLVKSYEQNNENNNILHTENIKNVCSKNESARDKIISSITKSKKKELKSSFNVKSHSNNSRIFSPKSTKYSSNKDKKLEGCIISSKEVIIDSKNKKKNTSKEPIRKDINLYEEKNSNNKLKSHKIFKTVCFSSLEKNIRK